MIFTVSPSFFSSSFTVHILLNMKPSNFDSSFFLGTKIVYERSFLMNLRSSPISRTPPKCDIPEHIQKDYKYPKKQEPFKRQVPAQKKTPTKGAEDGHQFDMDM